MCGAGRLIDARNVAGFAHALQRAAQSEAWTAAQFKNAFAGLRVERVERRAILPAILQRHRAQGEHTQNAARIAPDAAEATTWLSFPTDRH
jgi:hypothetical protein